MLQDATRMWQGGPPGELNVKAELPPAEKENGIQPGGPMTLSGTTWKNFRGDPWRPCGWVSAHSYPHAASACVTRATTAAQFPRCVWRKSRMLGYQGMVSPSKPQRQSGTSGSKVHTGLPNAPARWATAVSTVMRRSNRSRRENTNLPSRRRTAPKMADTLPSGANGVQLRRIRFQAFE